MPFRLSTMSQGVGVAVSVTFTVGPPSTVALSHDYYYYQWYIVINSSIQVVTVAVVVLYVVK